MPRPGHHRVQEKPKNFKASIRRLFQELRHFRIVIFIALVLAAGGSILSISAPNQLSKLTDQISEGLIPNKKVMEDIGMVMANNLDSQTLQEKCIQILDLQVDEKTIQAILSSDSISKEEKQSFFKDLETMKQGDISVLSRMDPALSSYFIQDGEYDGILISREDKLALLTMLEKKDVSMDALPVSLQTIFLPSFDYEGVTISTEDQISYLNIASSLKNVEDVSLMYQQLDKMPNSIQSLIKPKMDMDRIVKISLFLAGLYILSATFTYVQALIMATVSNRFAQELRNRISVKINKLPLQFFDHHQTGDILSRITNDVDTIAQSMNQSLSSLVSSITLFVGTVIMMFITNWQMALTAILSSFFGFIFMFMILGKSQKYFATRQKELGKLNSHIEEVYSGLLVVKAYNGKKSADAKFDEVNHRVYEANQKSMFLSGLMQPLMGFIGNFGYLAVCVVGALLTMNHVITFGVIVAFMTYVRLFTSPLQQIAQAFTSLQSSAAAGDRVFEFLDEQQMSEQEEVTKVLDRKEVVGKIEFEHVHFGYSDQKTVIEDFSAVAYPGQKIAIVGPTGAGKTTMVNLLMKFYEISQGDIRIDDVSIHDLTRENVHDLFTMVLQDTWLFEGTIRENIVFNRKGIMDAQIMGVCDIVGLRHFIETLPHGLDTCLKENDSVSAGQKQLLTIARAMLDDSPFLILDEATSNVDTRTEELVQKAMDKLSEGRTSFIIAHRLSTIRNADLILVVNQGNIVESGNHDSLIGQNGFYANLYNSQFETMLEV
ncbi:MAG: ABC transporter ATP-binding protein [Bacillota bacterium]|nr:ABC transporter ATP-binding protein [Bacillota bacterium]